MSAFTLLHVIAGMTGLGTGIIVMAMPNKGNKTHKRLGMVYLISMLVSTLLSIYLCFKINSTALLSVGLFTFYMLLSGFISVPGRYQKLKYFIFPLAAIGIFSGVYMIMTGVIFLLVFGGLQIVLVIQDLLMLRHKKPHPLDLTGSHAGKMAGSFIAASTAFAVNVIFTGGEWWHWLLPTFVITPLITRWNIQLAKRKKKLMAKA